MESVSLILCVLFQYDIRQKALKLTANRYGIFFFMPLSLRKEDKENISFSVLFCSFTSLHFVLIPARDSGFCQLRILLYTLDVNHVVSRESRASHALRRFHA